VCNIPHLSPTFRHKQTGTPCIDSNGVLPPVTFSVSITVRFSPCIDSIWCFFTTVSSVSVGLYHSQLYPLLALCWPPCPSLWPPSFLSAVLIRNRKERGGVLGKEWSHLLAPIACFPAIQTTIDV
jgi:hypothetical protein